MATGGFMKLKSSNLAPGFVLLTVLTGAEAEIRFFHSASPLVAQAATAERTRQQSDVAEEESLPQESKEREARLAKNLRYNGGGCDVTQGEDCFMEQYEPRALPLIPLAEGAIAFKGQVVKMQCYLSADRTHVYTEATWKVDEMFKQPTDFKLSSDEIIITDQIGGAIKLHSGRI